MKILAPLQKNYRFSLGKEMCKKYNLKPGDLLQIQETPEGILLVPVKVVPKTEPYWIVPEPSGSSDSHN